ncbi:MAG: NADPH-dependent curcumin reductase CurA [Myxococcota bacterium]|jgi:NADPH-dependent curcumin reductase CurA
MRFASMPTSLPDPSNWAFTNDPTPEPRDGEVAINARMLRPIDPNVGPLAKQMGGLGMTGFSAHFGLLDIGKPKEGDTVVSASAGAFGSVADSRVRYRITNELIIIIPSRSRNQTDLRTP